MNVTLNLRRSMRTFGLVSSAVACAVAVQAAAQSKLDAPSLSIPAASQKSAGNIKAEKTATAGRSEIAIGNHGMEPVTGIVVTEKVGTGRACPASTPVTITGSAVPEGRFTIADLTGAGIVLGTLSGDQVATLSYSCGVN